MTLRPDFVNLSLTRGENVTGLKIDLASQATLERVAFAARFAAEVPAVLVVVFVIRRDAAANTLFKRRLSNQHPRAAFQPPGF